MNAMRVRALAGLLLLTLLPGVGELVENAIHLATRGHLAHATAAGDDHAPPAREHGCSGTLHLCQCCVHPSLTLTPPPTLATPAQDRDVATTVAARPVSASPDAPYRPPRT